MRIFALILLCAFALNIKADLTLIANLSGEHVQPATGSSAVGRASIVNTGILELAVYIQVDGLSSAVQSISVRSGTPGSNGPQIGTGLLQEGHGFLIATSEEFNQMMLGNHYVRIDTVDYPSGEIFGPLNLHLINMEANLDNVWDDIEHSTSAATGIATFTQRLSASTGLFSYEYEIDVDGLEGNVVRVWLEPNQQLVLVEPDYANRIIELNYPSGSTTDIHNALLRNFVQGGSYNLVIATDSSPDGEIGGRFRPRGSGLSWGVAPETVDLSLNASDVYSGAMDVTAPGQNWMFVIDDTGSMWDEIAAVKDTATSAIAAVTGTPELPGTFVLSTFDDQSTFANPFDAYRTSVHTDPQEFLNNLYAVRAQGGGDCPEDSITGMRNAVLQLPFEPGKRNEMFLFTDATPRDVDDTFSSFYDRDNLTKLKAELMAKNTRVHVVYSSSFCNPDWNNPVYGELARMTGGNFIPALPFSVNENVEDVILSVFEDSTTLATPAPVACDPLTVEFFPQTGQSFTETIAAPDSYFDDLSCEVQITNPHGEQIATQQISATSIFVDSDGDGHPDSADNCPNIANEMQIDSDADGVGDVCDAFPNDSSESEDSDGDGVGDNSDLFPNDADESADLDQDGIGDNGDNCPATGNADQLDADGDLVGDACDAFPDDPTETTDSDGDGVGDNSDAFPDDPTETTDTDGDGVGDNGDAFPDDPTETTDSDGDGVGDNSDAFPDDPTETTDTDGDGVGDNGDAFPDDPTETTDTDGDGVGDNGDAFPNDPTETTDTDGDGVGDNADAFPDDPTETTDSDGDGVGDNGDAFPNDPNESADTDGDGVGDNGDAFPNDPNETADTDGDGVGDNGDAFPNDPNETVDSDGDGVGDNGDAFPNDPNETADSDGDGVGDNGDAFPNDPNETADSDSDGVGDNGDAFPSDPNETADSDGDGVGDNSDSFPNSDNSPTVDYGDEDSGVENRQLDNGATLADTVNAASDACASSGGATCMTDALKDLEEQGLITKQERQALHKAVAHQQGEENGNKGGKGKK